MPYTRWNGRIWNDLRSRIRIRIRNKLFWILNPILHTAWLDNHFEKKFCKILFPWKIQIFAYFPKILLWIKENLS
jgi:hypothetical protein